MYVSINPDLVLGPHHAGPGRTPENQTPGAVYPMRYLTETVL